jgi:hypothetical protein
LNGSRKALAEATPANNETDNTGISLAYLTVGTPTGFLAARTVSQCKDEKMP